METAIAAWPRSKGSRRAFSAWLPAWAVLSLSLCGTAFAWYFTHSAVQREAQTRFQAEITDIQMDLVDRLRTYEQVLRGGVSVFYSWPSVTRENWRRYVEHLQIAQNYPGIQGLGFAQVIPAAEKQSHVLEMRAKGLPDYRIWPEGEREIYTSIVFLEPFDWRNQRALGYDMFREPVRRAAMERARDTGLASLSGKVTLVQETESPAPAGFLMYLPVYATPAPAATAARRHQLIGYVYGPFRMNDFIRGLLGSRRRNVALQIFDATTTSDEALMHGSASPDVSRSSATSPFVDTLWVNLYGRTWTLRFSALTGFSPDTSKALIVAGGGIVVSFLLWAVVWSLAKHRVDMAAANDQLQSDIARREEVEAQLREAESGFRYLFEKNPNPMWLSDRETLSILEANEAATVHLGYSRDELRQMRMTEFCPAQDVPRLESYLKDRSRALKDAGEWRHVTKDGRTIDVEIARFTLSFRQRDAVLVVARDITESKRAEEALKESEAVARAVLDSALDAYIRMDRDGLITEWNLVAEKTFGWTRDEVLGRPLQEIIIPHDEREAHRRGLEHFLASGEGPLLNRRIEVQALHRSGELFPVELTVQAVETMSNRYFSAFVRDLSERKQAEAQLRQAQKMEAVGHLTGGIAHDFNNLLTIIIGNLELVHARDPGRPPDVQSIEHALEAAHKGAALTHRLLAFSRRQALQPTRTDLNRMIAGMTDLLRRTLPENIEIEVRLEEDLWPELADRNQVENALLNLVINSRDAMPDGGKLTIETANVTLDQEYAERYEEVEAGDYVMLAVTDTGTGMPQEVIEQAVEPFFTTKGAGKGSGLGLSMIYGFAKQSGGHLKVYSEVGHGTTVKLYLPRAAEAQPESPAPPRHFTDLRGDETILVVEDEDAVRKLVVMFLTRLGYRVLEAPDVRRALELLRGEERIDLLFTDVVLPGGLTGRQLADRGTALRPGMRVLFTSGYTQNSIAHQGKLDPGVHLLSKPYRREDLARKVREALGSGPAVKPLD